MMKKEIHKIETEQAWQRLYNRLDKDCLLNEVTDERRHMPLRWMRYGGAAAVLACVIWGAVYWTTAIKQEMPNLITQTNQENSTLVTTLEDGSLVLLAKETSLLYPEHFVVDKRQVNLRGNAFFDIAKKQGQPFLIETEQVSIEVLGTAFSVQNDRETPFSLSVERGCVRVSLKKSNRECYVRAGETVNLRSQQLVVAKTAGNQFNDYFKRIRFKDETLGNILKVMNLNAGHSSILIASPALGERRLTVEFSNESSEVIALLIAGALNLKSIRQGESFLLAE